MEMGGGGVESVEFCFLMAWGWHLPPFPRFPGFIAAQTGYRTKAVMAVPICNADGEVVAVAEMINKNRLPSGIASSPTYGGDESIE